MSIRHALWRTTSIRPETLIILCLLIVIGLRPLTDPDLGWHLRIGQETWNQLAPPSSDSFSFSLPGHDFVAHSWLFDLGLWLSWSLAGPIGLQLIYIGLILGLYQAWSLNLSSHAQSRWWLLLLLVPSLSFVGLRPHLITMIGLSLVYYYYSKPGKLPVPYLALFFWLWANTHAGVTLGLLAFAFGWAWHQALELVKLKRPKLDGLTDLKYLLIFTIICLVNPYTWQIFNFSAQLAFNQTAQSFNTDWLPLLSSLHSQYSLGLRLGLLLGTVAYIVWLASNRQRGWLVPAMLMTLISSRYAIVTITWLMPLIGRSLDQLLQSHVPTKLYGRLLPVVVSLFVIASNLNPLAQWWCGYTRPDCYALLNGYPTATLEKLASMSPGKRVFNHYTWGGYLLWKAPEQLVFIDGRMDSFYVEGESFMAELIRIEMLETDWYERLVGYQPDLALIEKDSRLAQALQTRDDWVELGRDQVAVLLEYKPDTNSLK